MGRPSESFNQIRWKNVCARACVYMGKYEVFLNDKEMNEEVCV